MGRHKTTMTDIAQTCGVSQSTVSIVLNQKGSGMIPQETIDRILLAAKEMGYQKQNRANRRDGEKHNAVLVLVSDLTNPYYSYILHELELAAAPSQLQMVCCNTYHQVERECMLLEMAVRNRFFAAVFLYPPDDPEHVKQVSRQMPVIAICDKNAASEIDLIELNNFQAGYIAAEHLISLGHRRIAVLSSDPQRRLARMNRIQGVAKKITESGLDQEFSVIVPKHTEIQRVPGNNNNYKIGYALGQREELLSARYTAFIAINDMVAMGVIDALSGRGAHFPEDYSIVGFDNLLYTGLSRISLTTVDYHTELLAQAAIDLLTRRTSTTIDSAWLSAARFKVECMPQLVVRSSTAPPR